MKIKYIITLSLSVTLIAQSAAETLKYIAQETLINNPEIQALRENTKAYRKYVDEEQSAYYPTLNLETYFEEMKTLQDGSTTQKNGTNTQIKLEQTLFDGGLRSSKVSEADHNYRSNKIKNIAKIETIVQDAISAYLDVVKHEELTLLSKNNLEIHEDYLITAQQSEEVSGDSLDRMQVESKLFSAKAKYIKLQDDRNKAKANLEKLYGKKLTGLICRPVVDERLISKSLEGEVTNAVGSNFTILETLEGIKAQRSVLSQEQSRFFPTIKARVMREIDDGVDARDVKKTEDTIRLTLSYNIFNGFKDNATYERERIFLQESQKSLDDIVNGIKEEVKINYSKYQSAKDRIKFLKEYLVKNKSILQIYLEQFEGGTRSFIDILNHEAEIFRAKTELVEEEFTYYTSYFTLLGLRSNLSESVIANKNQVCQEIKVDIEKRDLRVREDVGDDDLESLFKDELPGESQEIVDTKQQQDAEVQSILNQILEEIYNPEIKNSNINVSGQGTKSQEKYFSKDSEPKKSKIDVQTQRTIKELQEQEEAALRKETEELKAQIHQEAEKLLNDDEPILNESSTNENIVNEEVIEKSTSEKPIENLVDKANISKDEKSKIQKLLDERERLRKLAAAIENEVKNKPISKMTKPVSKKSWDEMTLKEQQAESRRLGAEIRRKFREKIAQEEAAKVKAHKEAKTQKLKAQEKQQAATETKRQEELNRIELEKEKAVLKEQEEAKKLQEAKKQKEAAIKRALELQEKNLAKQRAEKLQQEAKEKEEQLLREEQLKQEEERKLEIKRKEEDEAEKQQEEALRKKREEALKRAQEAREKAVAVAKQKEEAKKEPEIVETTKVREQELKDAFQAEFDKARAQEVAAIESTQVSKTEEKVVDANEIKKAQDEALAKAKIAQKAAKEAAEKRAQEEKLKAEKEAKAKEEAQEAATKEKLRLEKEADLKVRQAESRRIAAEIRRKFQEKIALEEAEKKAAQQKIIEEEKAKKTAQRKAEEVATAKRVQEEKAKAEALQKKQEAIAKAKALQETRRLNEEKIAKAKALEAKKKEEAQKSKAQSEKAAQIARIKQEQEAAQLRLRQEAKLQEEKDQIQRSKDEAARAKAKAIIDDIKSNQNKSASTQQLVSNVKSNDEESAVVKAQKIVDEIKQQKVEENQQQKAQNLAETMKGKEAINPLKSVQTAKSKELQSQDDARLRAKAIVDELRANKQVKSENQDTAQKAKEIVNAIVQKKQSEEMVSGTVQQNDEVVNKAKALVSEIKSQTPSKDDSLKKAKSLISDLQTNENKKLQEYRFKEDQTLEKVDNYVSLKKEFNNLNSKKYTIAILTLDSNKNTKAIQQRYGLNEDVVSYRLMNDGKAYYKIIYGVFETAEEAQKEIEALHPRLQANRPFVDRITKHQKLYQKYNTKSGE